MKYQSKNQVIEAAQKLGSSASTFRGAVKYLRANPPTSAFRAAKRRTPRWLSPSDAHRWNEIAGMERSEDYAARHNARLCIRYVGAKRLPRYLSDVDRKTIANHPANADFSRLSALPVYARGHYLPDDSPIRQIPRYARFVKKARTNKGHLVAFSSVATHAFSVCDFGRTRKNHTGEVSLYPGVRTESYERGRNPWGGKWVHSDYYADYTLIRAKDHGRVYGMYYVAPDRRTRTVYVSPNWLKIGAGSTPQRRKLDPPKVKPLPVHVQRRILSVPAALRIDFDREAKKLMVVDRFGEQYHLPEIRSADKARTQILEAVRGLRKRRAEKIRISDPSRVWVCIEDSYAAGNCRTMTDQFASEFFARIGAEGQVCVRGDLLLSVRDDAYTRRTVSYAATR